MATHVSIVLRNHYFGRHEATRIPGIPGAGNFVFTTCALGLRNVRVARPTLFSRQCGLPTKSTTLRTHPQHTTGGLFVDQLCACCAVRFVLPDDKRTVSNVAVVGVRVGGRCLYCNGDTRGSSGGHQRRPSLPLARFNSRCRRGRDWGRDCASLEWNAEKAASYLGRSQQIGRAQLPFTAAPLGSSHFAAGAGRCATPGERRTRVGPESRCIGMFCNLMVCFESHI